MNGSRLAPPTRTQTRRAHGRIPIAMMLVVVWLLHTLVLSAQTADGAQRAANRAHAFLYTKARGQEILNYVHMGASYHGHEYLRTVAVTDRWQKTISGQFALVYRFWWEEDGFTDIAFLCDGKGNVYRLQIVDTNAVLNQPFVLANAAIQLVGNALVQLYKDRMSDNDRRSVQRLVSDADSKGIVEWLMVFEQAFGG